MMRYKRSSYANNLAAWRRWDATRSSRSPMRRPQSRRRSTNPISTRQPIPRRAT